MASFFGDSLLSSFFFVSVLLFTCLHVIAGLPRARSARGTEPHTHRLLPNFIPSGGLGKEDVNFKKQVICSMHWSCGKRLNLEDLPTVKFTEVGNQIRVPESQARALELRCYALH